MAKLIMDGQEFTGSEFGFKNGILYVDGHAVVDYKERAIRIDGHANITTDKDVIFREEVTHCTINAARVIFNATPMNCRIKADSVVENS